MSAYELSIALISGILIPVVAILVTIFLAYKPEHIPFKLLRQYNPIKEPIESNIAIIVSHPDKTIEKCRVIYNGHELIAYNGLSYATVLAQGMGGFHIPRNTEDEEATITVKDGRHTLRKEKLRGYRKRGRNSSICAI